MTLMADPSSSVNPLNEDGRDTDDARWSEASRCLVELGRLMDAVSVVGRESAKGTQPAWETFVRDLLSGEESVSELAQARQLVATVSSAPTHEGAPPLNAPTLWDYFAARVLRAIVVEPALLSQRWHAVCRTRDLPEPYTYVTAHVFQEPLIAIRHPDRARIFLNTCTHRQAELLRGCGMLEPNQKILCKYHGWAFDCAGECLNVAGANHGVFGAEPASVAYRLQEVFSAEAHGVVYAWFGQVAPPAEARPPRLNGLGDEPPAALKIAHLLHSVQPSYPKVKQPEVPSWARSLLRLGRVQRELERVAHQIARRLDLNPRSVLEGDRRLSASERAQVETRVLELKQCLLDVEPALGDWQELLDQMAESARVNGAGDLPPADSPAKAFSAPGSPTGVARETQPALPQWLYGNRDLFLQEFERLIKPSWQFVAHQNEIAKAGEFTWVDFLGQRVYVIRRADGSLFAGTAKMPGDGHPDLSQPERRLEPVDFDCWNGLVFIRLAPGGPPVAEVWECPGLLEPYDIARMEPLYGPGWYDFDVEADYKILWENFLELYHFPMTHKGTCRLFQVVHDSDLLSLRIPPAPGCTAAEASYVQNLQASAPHSMDYELQLRRLAETEKKLPHRFHFTMFGSYANQQVCSMTLGLTVYPDFLETMTFVPLGPHDCRVRYRSYGHRLDPGSETGRALAAARAVNTGSIQIVIVEEDILVNYLAQTGLSAQTFRRPGVLGNLELSVQEFQDQLRRKLFAPS